jgi:hypothetical protein
VEVCRLPVSETDKVGRVEKLADETLVAIGRMTVAATELEHLLAWIGADQAGGDAAGVFVQPGEPLRAARGSVEFAPPAFRNEYINMVDAAGAQLAQSQAALRTMWREGGRTHAAMFDEIAARLLRCRDALQALVDAHLNGAENRTLGRRPDYRVPAPLGMTVRLDDRFQGISGRTRLGIA